VEERQAIVLLARPRLAFVELGVALALGAFALAARARGRSCRTDRP
jgi:hypothetical protein